MVDLWGLSSQMFRLDIHIDLFEEKTELKELFYSNALITNGYKIQNTNRKQNTTVKMWIKVKIK